jgi:hypothetical protein
MRSVAFLGHISSIYGNKRLPLQPEKEIGWL